MLSGELRTLVHESTVLRDNPLGDPPIRELPVYLPPGSAPGSAPGSTSGSPEDLPLIAVLAGYGGNGRSALHGTPWEPSFPERYERLLVEGLCQPAAFVFPDAFTRFGGSQYMNSNATGRYEDWLVDEVFPFVEAQCGVGGRPERRGLMGKSSGGFGALHVCFQRPGVFRALASHSGDADFELGYKPEFGRLLEMLDRHGGVEQFVDAFESAERITSPQFIAMSVLAMASVYSPDPSETLGVALPFDVRTGRLRDDVWARWLEHDPVHLAERRGEVLRDHALVFIDAGLSDEYHLQFGARQLVEALRARGVSVEHQEFDGGHMGVSYRYESSLPLMTEALSR
jgi:enterochelin esterase-like enzyme